MDVPLASLCAGFVLTFRYARAVTDSSVPSQRSACPRCGGVVEYFGRGRRPVWCSQVCRQEAYETRRAARENDHPIEVVVRERDPQSLTLEEHVRAVLDSPTAIVKVMQGVGQLRRSGQLEQPKWQRLNNYLSYPHWLEPNARRDLFG